MQCIMKKRILFLLLFFLLLGNQNRVPQNCGSFKFAPNVTSLLKMIGYQDLSLEQLRKIPIEQIKFAAPPAMQYPTI